jgi:hypothetical protein
VLKKTENDVYDTISRPIYPLAQPSHLDRESGSERGRMQAANSMPRQPRNELQGEQNQAHSSRPSGAGSFFFNRVYVSFIKFGDYSPSYKDALNRKEITIKSL